MTQVDNTLEELCALEVVLENLRGKLWSSTTSCWRMSFGFETGGRSDSAAAALWSTQFGEKV